MSRNVVLIVLDSVRKNLFDTNAGTLRNRADLDVAECRAASNWSPSSHGAMFTGELPHQNGVHAHGPNWDEIETVDTFLSAYDQHTKIGVSSNLFAGRPHGFDRYFDQFVSLSRHSVLSGVKEIDTFRADSDRDGLGLYLEYLCAARREGTLTRSLVNGLIFKYHEFADGRPLPRLWDYGTRTSLRATRNRLTDIEEPAFVFQNLMETHNPFANSICYRGENVPMSWSSDQFDTYTYNNLAAEERPPDYARNYRALYEESIRYTTDRIVEFVDWCDANLDRPTTFVITGDHGEQLGSDSDGGLISHVGTLSESLLHVPLVVINPPADTHVTDGRYLSHLDLAGLMRGLTDDTLALRYRDRIPAEVIGSSAPDETDRFDFWDRMIRAAYDGREKYVWDSLGDRRQYRVGDTQCEETEVATDIKIPQHALAHFDVPIEEFKAQFDDEDVNAWAADAPTERLKKLGYL
jgi:arylsulfatase A-like enzyme